MVTFFSHFNVRHPVLLKNGKTYSCSGSPWSLWRSLSTINETSINFLLSFSSWTMFSTRFAVGSPMVSSLWISVWLSTRSLLLLALGDKNQGNLCKGVVIWVVAARFVVQSPKQFFWQFFTNNVGHICIWVFIQIFFWEKICIKTCNFEPCCYIIKSMLLRREYKLKLF